MPPHTADLVKTRLGQLFEELLAHDGYADLSVEMRILKRGQKEVVIRCGKQYRYVVDVPALVADDLSSLQAGAMRPFAGRRA